MPSRGNVIRNDRLRMLPRKCNRQLRYGLTVAIPAQIVKEILIEATIEDVWRVVTEPDQITQSFSRETELDRRTDGAGRLRFESGQIYYLHVEAFSPTRRFAYRWL